MCLGTPGVICTVLPMGGGASSSHPCDLWQQKKPPPHHHTTTHLPPSPPPGAFSTWHHALVLCLVSSPSFPSLLPAAPESWNALGVPWGYPGGALGTRCSTRTRRHKVWARPKPFVLLFYLFQEYPRRGFAKVRRLTPIRNCLFLGTHGHTRFPCAFAFSLRWPQP